jgi:hypothetical protein
MSLVQSQQVVNGASRTAPRQPYVPVTESAG